MNRYFDDYTLRHLSTLDPDGHATEPTDAMRDTFRAYVLERFGRDVYDLYFTDNGQNR